MKIKFETDLSDLPDDTLKRLDKFICNEFLLPFKRMGIKPKDIVAAFPWRIMFPIQYERTKRAKRG